jgi:drug/metabolite transporter (DMT)-like permease
VSIAIGILLSWVATVLWNVASLALPVSLTAQLIVVGTIAGVVLVHVVTMTWPNLWELSGLAVSTAGVLLAVRATLPPRSAAPEAVSLRDVGQLDHSGALDLGMPVKHGLDPA